jgi:Ca2+-binding EF-hand superfamily protein
MTRVGDVFIRQLAEKGEDFSKFYAFTEFVESIDSRTKVPDTETIPVGLKKMKELGIRNPIIEADLAYPSIDYKIFNVEKITKLFSQRMEWVRENLSRDAKIFINLRDIADAIINEPERVFKVVKYLSSLPANQRPFGLIFEEPTGNYLPDHLAAWTAAVRGEMDECGFQDGHLLVHIHEKWGLAQVSQLECLIKGATGIWCSVCEEGAALGHACSSVTLLNMIRLGNEQVLKQYNCVELRRAAQEVTRITTANEPHPKQPVYGERALDIVFDGMMGSNPDDEGFCMATFFGQKPLMRMTTLASPRMVVERLKTAFGENTQFTEDMAQRMLDVMLEDLHENRKEEYMSKVGLAILFDRSGGKLTDEMAEAIEDEKPKTLRGKMLIAEIRKSWDEWDLRDGEKDDQLEFDAFYNGFMAPYFGCYRCDTTTRALKAIDMDEDGKVDWNEFSLYLKWAIREYPEAKDAEELLSVAFRKGLIPAMQDEMLKQN